MSKKDFYSLTPDEVLAAVDHNGFHTTGEFSQLNSYENRVFDLKLEVENENSRSNLIVKFYRPERWSKAMIQEEHDFLSDLEDGGLPVVAPLKLFTGNTIEEANGMYFSCFPKAKGRMCQELLPKDLQRLGRSLARLHNIGESRTFEHRPSLTVEEILDPGLKASQEHCAPELREKYRIAAEDVADYLLDTLVPENYIRIHGDCHKGNFLEVDEHGKTKEFFFVDFDDSVMGPVAQDFWMLLSGDEDESQDDLECLMNGYLELRNLNESDLDILPALRGLRIIHYSGWIARRWEDPSFPKLFPQFHDFNHWAEETEALEAIARKL